MNCPKCGRPYESDDSICPFCNTPLGNAIYMPVATAQKKKRHILTAIVFILIFLSLAGFIGYHIYIRIVENECEKITKQLMDSAKKMDFSSLDQEDLPEPLSGNSDLKEIISQKIDDKISESGLSEPLDTLGIDIDYDDIFDQILLHAEYSITDVNATYNRCTVTMTTSNINYYNITNTIKDKLQDVISGNSSSSGWWGTLKDLVNSWLNTGDSSETLPTTLSGWIEKLMGDQEPETVKGKIVYGIRGGHWTIISIDKNLLYNFYGFPEK